MSTLGLETPRTLRVIVPVGGTPTAAQELEIVAGSGVTLTGTRTGARIELEVAASGGGGGAPTGAEYVVLSANGSLPSERVLTAGTGITLTDAGAGSTLTVAVEAGLASLTSADATAGLPYVTAANTWATATLGDLAVSGGAWTVTDLTITSEAHGDLLYRGASAWLRLAASTADYVLTTQGAGAAPVWKAISSILSAGLGALATLLDGADQPNNECWIEGWKWDGSARVRSWVPAATGNLKLAHTVAVPDTTTISSLGVSSPTASSAASAGFAAETRYLEYTGTGDTGVRFHADSSVLALRSASVVCLTFVTYSDMTSIRFIVAMTSETFTTQLGSAAPTSGSYVQLRYDTGAGDTTFKLVCRDGTTVGAVVDTGVTPAADTRYDLAFSMNHDGTEVQVWLATGRGAYALVATLDSSDNIPGSTTALRVMIACKALSGTKGVRWSHFSRFAA